MGTGHAHEVGAGRSRALVMALSLNVVIVLGQALAGVRAHSLGLLADAGHNLVDVAAILLALTAVRWSRRAPTTARSYGYHRATILAALANAVLIVAVTGWLAVEGVRRLDHPPAVRGGLVAVVALAAALLNVIAVLVVREPGGRDLNLRAVMLHLAGDVVASLAVAAAGLAIWLGGPYLLDPAASLVVALLIGVQAIRLVRDSADVLLESTPSGLDVTEMVGLLCLDPGVISVHDLHVWSLSSDVRAMSAHVLVSGHPSLEQARVVGDRLKARLAADFAIGHATLELECENCDAEPPPVSSSRPPHPGGRLHVTKRGQVVLAVLAVLVVLLIAASAGAFSGSGSSKASGKKASGAKASVTGTTTAPKPGTTSAAGTSGAARTTISAPTHRATAVHSVIATTSTWHLTAPLSRSVVLPVSGGLELLGGLLNGDHSSSLVQRIALPAGTLTSDGKLAIGVHDAAGAAHQNALFVYAGGASAEVSTVQKATPAGSATTAGALPAPRSDLVSVTVEGKVVLIGGYDGTRILADVLVSSDGVHFSVLTQLPVPVRYPAAVVHGGQIFVYGGDVARKPVDVIQRIDLATGKATVVGHLPEPISHEAGLLFGTTVWLAGGTTPSGVSGRLWRSDDGVAFTRAGSLPEPRSDAGVAMLHGVGYLVGGEGAHRFDTTVVVKPG